MISSARESFNQNPIVFQSYRGKSPLQKWNFFCEISGFVLKISGTNIFDPDFRITFITVICGMAGANFILSMVYTIYHYRSDFFTAIQGLTWIGTLVSVSIRIIPIEIDVCRLVIVFIQYSTDVMLFQTLIVYFLTVRKEKCESMRKLLFFPGAFIYKDFNAPPKYTKVCDESANRLFKSVIQDISLLFVAMLTPSIIPVYKKLILHERILFLPVLLPFTDPATNFGYYINQLHQLLLSKAFAVNFALFWS